MKGLEKRSISLSGHRTSIALEAEFWCVIDIMAQREGCSLAGFIARLDTQRSAQQSLASVLRVAALRYTTTSHDTVFLPEPCSEPSTDMVRS